jgi:hypothetical protein
MNKNILIGVGGILLVAVGYFVWSALNGGQNIPKEMANSEIKNSSEGTMEHDATQMAQTSDGSVVDGSKLLKIENVNKLASGQTFFKFKLLDEFGMDIKDTDLKINHEKLLHFLVAKDDLSVFEHLHPEYKNNYWEVSAKNLNKGSYNLYTDITLNSGVAKTIMNSVDIEGKTTIKNIPKISINSSAKIGDYQAEIVEKDIETGSSHPLTFKITKLGSGISNIDPYLGAYGHVVIIDQIDPMNFVHAHPVTDKKPTDSVVKFETKLPKPGTYTIFAQFNIGGDVKIFPITVKTVSTPNSGSTSH